MKRAYCIEVNSHPFNEKSMENTLLIISVIERIILKSSSILDDHNEESQIMSFIDFFKRIFSKLEVFIEIFRTNQFKTISQIGNLVNKINIEVLDVTLYGNSDRIN